MKNTINACLVFVLSLFVLSSCKKKDETKVEEPAPSTSGAPIPAPTNTAAATYLRWTSASTGFTAYVANHFVNGKIHQNPYVYSIDGGNTWKEDPNDGLGREFLRFNGKVVEKRNGSGGSLIYTPLTGGAAITLSAQPSQFAWNTGGEAWVVFNKKLFRSNNGGANWQEINAPLNSQLSFVTYTDLDLIDGSLYLVQQYNQGTGVNVRYILQVSSDGGITWKESAAQELPIQIRAVGLTEVFAILGTYSSIGGGVFKVKVSSNLTFEPLEFLNGVNVVPNFIGRLPTGELFIGTATEGYYIPKTGNGKLYNPSKLPSGISGAVFTDSTIVVTAGRTVYTTQIPLKFYETE